MHVPVVPESMEQVTAEWLTLALRSGATLPTGRVVRATPTPCAGELGLLSERYQVRLEYEGAPADAPRTLIAKLPVRASESAATAQAFRLYQREVKFYCHLPEGSREHFPRCFYGAVNAEGTSFVLLLEDLSHYRVGDQARGAGEAQLQAALSEAARMHGKLWQLLSAHPDWLIEGRATFHAGTVAALYGSALPPFLSKAGERLSAVQRRAAERLLDYIPVYWEQMAEPPVTLQHGDLRLDNMLFGAHDERRSVVLLDLQVCARGRAGHDIGYFLSQSVPTELRRGIGGQALREYHRQLLAHGAYGYDFAMFEHDVRRSVMYHLIVPVIVGAHLDPTTEGARAFMSTFLARALSAIDDLQAYELVDEQPP